MRIRSTLEILYYASNIYVIPLIIKNLEMNNPERLKNTLELNYIISVVTVMEDNDIERVNNALDWLKTMPSNDNFAKKLKKNLDMYYATIEKNILSFETFEFVRKELNPPTSWTDMKKNNNRTINNNRRKTKKRTKGMLLKRLGKAEPNPNIPKIKKQNEKKKEMAKILRGNSDWDYDRRSKRFKKGEVSNISLGASEENAANNGFGINLNDYGLNNNGFEYEDPRRM